MDVLTSNECRSCTIYERITINGDIKCEILKTKNVHRCPCTNCLVKMTCVTSCDEFDALMIQCKNMYAEMRRMERDNSM